MKRYSALGVLAATALSVTLTACTAAGGGSGTASPTSNGSTASNGSAASASAGAGGGSGSATGGSTGSTGSSGSAGSTGGNTGSGGSGATGATGGGSGNSSGLAACTGTQLTVSVGPNDAAAGHIAVAFQFTNNSDTPCTLYGYPGLAMIDSSGRQVLQAKRTLRGFTGGAATGSTHPPLVTVAPHGHVAARLEWSDVPQGGLSQCPTYAGVVVTPPGTRTSTTFKNFQPVACAVQIHPVLPGDNGYQP